MRSHCNDFTLWTTLFQRYDEGTRKQGRGGGVNGELGDGYVKIIFCIGEIREEMVSKNHKNV